jgi:hypothetical protein
MARSKRTIQMSRLNLEMTQDNRKRLESLRDKTGANSLAEVIQRALSVYDYLQSQKDEGIQLILRQGEREKELVLI